ncbi:hypothetical protein DT076_18395 [Desertihabitans brevis]|uniref:Uncharacterized protein n=1 Tax=Desertihabitans brevis TaxID=2268447 RepID=A0A367YQA4_9ACTN|nr:hypothetical protein [Desertihabitans brevis]RCK68024.1 hypothetical protein DT076_18395 [Desertihabitans brevis]
MLHLISALLPPLLLYVAFLVVVGVFTRGRVRALGLAAGVLFLVQSVLSGAVLPLLARELDVAAGQFGLVASLFNILHWVAVGLVAAALVVAGRSGPRQELPHRYPPTGARPGGPGAPGWAPHPGPPQHPGGPSEPPRA